MDAPNLDEWVRAQDDLLETFRGRGREGGSQDPSVHSVPPEKTNWIGEQKALIGSCALGDLSHHMTAVSIEGPDAIELLKRLCVNDFDDFGIGRAKQIVMCDPRGYLMGDGPLLRLGDRRFYSAGLHASKWLRFNLETGDYDVSVGIEPPTPLLPDGESPERFVYQVQGPETNDVLAEVTDADLRDIDFFAFERVELAGHDVIAFSHGMSPEAGFELVGPYEHAGEVKDAILDAGGEYGIRHLGRKAYLTQSTRVGWVPPWPKPVYDGDEMEAYRRWVDVEAEHAFGKAYWTEEETLESSFSIEGSFDSDDITDYYLRPVEVGYGKLVDLDHDFIGKEAVRRDLDGQTRTLVSLVWDDDDVTGVANSLFGDGEHYKPLGDFPLVQTATMSYDSVRSDGRTVGISYTRSFQWDVRSVVSLGSIDTGYSEPGTEVTVVWGEPGGHSPDPRIEDHVPTGVTATVRPVPYEPKRKG